MLKRVLQPPTFQYTSSSGQSDYYDNDIELGGKPEKVRQPPWIVRTFYSQAPVCRYCLNGCIFFGACLTFLPAILPPTGVYSLNDFPQLSYQRYMLSIAINLALSVPMLIDTILDNLNSLSSDHVANRLRVAVAASLFLPTLFVLLFCFRGDNSPYLLYVSLVICQQLVLYTLIFQILNVHDKEIWTDVRIAFLITGHVSGWVLFAMGVSLMTFFFILSDFIFLVNLAFFLFIVVTLWIPKYFRLFSSALAARREKIKESSSSCFAYISKYIFAMEGSVYSFMTADEAVSIFYLMIGVIMLVISLLPGSGKSIFLLSSYAQSAFIILLTVYPGRVARQKAKESDSALKSKKAFVQYISHEARGPLSVANMGLELHLIDLRQAMSSEASRQLSDVSSRQDWLAQRCVHVNEIVDSCTAAQNILNDLLTYDKIESGMLLMETDYLSLLPFIDKEFSPYSIQSRYKNISVHYNWKEGGIHPCYEHVNVVADKHKLAQVFRNLLSNALKFTPVDGKINVNVSILCCLEEPVEAPHAESSLLLMDSWLTKASAPTNSPPNTGGHVSPEDPSTTRWSGKARSERAARFSASSSGVAGASSVTECGYIDITEIDFTSLDRPVLDLICRVEVQDSGAGIKPENMPKLFGKYVQFDAAQMQQGGGTGLGLWLSKSLIEKHRGHIGCTSSGIDGEGSTFFFELPIDHLELQELQVPMEGPPSISSLDSVSNFSGGHDIRAQSVPLAAAGSPIMSSAPTGNLFTTSTAATSIVSAGTVLQCTTNKIWISPQAALRAAAAEAAEAGATKHHTTRNTRISPLPSILGDRVRKDSSSNHESTSLPFPLDRTYSGTHGGQNSAYNSAADFGGDPRTSGCVNNGASGPARLRQSGLWDDHAKLQSDMNALLSSSIDMNADTPTVPTLASIGMMARSRNASLIRKPNEKSTLLNIMVVDDTPLSRKMMKRAFKTIAGDLIKGLKIVVHVGEDGGDAIKMMEKASTCRSSLKASGTGVAGGTISGSGLTDAEEDETSGIYYDMLFIDSEMLKVNGAEAIQTIRQRLNYGGFIYAVTGHGTSEELSRLLEAGATDVYTKPVGIDQLKTLVEEYLDSLPIEEKRSHSISSTITKPLPSIDRGSGSLRLKPLPKSSTKQQQQQHPSSSPVVTQHDLEYLHVSSFNANAGSYGPNSSSEEGAPVSVPAPIPVPIPVPVPAPAPALRVMVVDDTSLHRKMIIRALRTVEKTLNNRSIEIHEGEDGQDAIDMVENFLSEPKARRYDVIFIDYDMVHVNGAVAIKVIREKYKYGGKIYAVTANEKSGEHAKLMEAGATDIFIKPLRVEQLQPLIEAILTASCN